MNPQRIAVLLHESDDRFASAGYLLPLLAERWKGDGIEVSIVRGVAPRANGDGAADLVIPHLDLTVVPDPYRRIMQRYPRAINGRCGDISKSAISANLLRRMDDYAGAVIVKTNFNYGGLPERRLPPPRRSLARRVVGRLMRMARPAAADDGWASTKWMKAGTYPIFASLAEVPEAVFENRHLIVEKFLPEMQGTNYCVRYSYFLGDRSIDFLLRSEHQVIKGANAISLEETPTPPELLAIRRRMRFDFGKFDYVIRDGHVVLFDANWTPACATLEQHRLTERVVSHLAGGIDSIMAEA